MPIRTLYFIALVFTALALGPALAHLFALPNKIAMGEADYFVAQQIYSGWALLGVLVYGALLSSLVLAWALRRGGAARSWALIAFLCIVGTQAIFWTWTFPANRETENWTKVPADWQRLRSEWEYSHAASAGLNLFAVAALVASLLVWKGEERRRG
jgi:hypothetical protein